MQVATAEPDQEQPLRRNADMCYALMAVGVLVSITYLAVPVIAHLSRRPAASSWLDSHFRWQLRTFWFSLLWLLVGLAGVMALPCSIFCMFLFVGHPDLVAFTPWLFGGGALLLAADTLWVIYRIIRGWVRLARRQPMYSPV